MFGKNKEHLSGTALKTDFSKQMRKGALLHKLWLGSQLPLTAKDTWWWWRQHHKPELWPHLSLKCKWDNQNRVGDYGEMVTQSPKLTILLSATNTYYHGTQPLQLFRGRDGHIKQRHADIAGDFVPAG